MYKVFIVLFIASILFSCKNKITQSEGKSLFTKKEVAPTTEIQVPYTEFLKTFIQQKNKTNTLLERQKLLCKAIDTDIPAYWKGTPWDFNGVTRTPQQGAIACGYFVTNILSDLDFKIKRVALAQQVSSVMIKELGTQVYTTQNLANLQKYIEQAPTPSVFIVGLDFHTGFISKNEQNVITFIHSNYIQRAGVMQEPLLKSAALSSSKNFMISCLTCNEALLQNWTTTP